MDQHIVDGSAGELHARDLIAESTEHGIVRPTVWWCRPTDPAIVVGSAQARGACGAPPMPKTDAAGRPIIARRSGGGAVLVGEDEGIWVDVVLGRDDPRWIDDVSHSADWLGRVWSRALADLGVGGAEMYAGPVEGRWGPQVCFAGRAGGEVLVGGRKLVGISQRRTRLGARFQTHVLRRWSVDPLIDVAVV
ncbi:MAG: lipoate--protein ligase family protein, partial [Acidimicrobiales bacterium]|nr:lipoate--protein ligase family protein [Acidimicrobiales bacterium]